MEVDSVTAGEGMCHVGLAWFCLLQLDCLTSVKPILSTVEALLLLFDRGSGVLAHLACCAKLWLCLSSFSPLSEAPAVSVFFLSHLICSCVWRVCCLGSWQPGNCTALCPQDKTRWAVPTCACMNAFASLTSSHYVPLFITRLSGWTSKTRLAVPYVSLSQDAGLPVVSWELFLPMNHTLIHHLHFIWCQDECGAAFYSVNPQQQSAPVLLQNRGWGSLGPWLMSTSAG